MNVRPMTVRAKLTVAFGLLAGLVVLVSGLALHALSDANDKFALYVHGVTARVNAAERVRSAVDRRAIAARNLVLVTKPVDLETEEVAVTQAHEDVQVRLKQLNDLMAGATDTTDQARSLVAAINRVESEYGPVATNIVRLALDNKRDEAIAEMNDQCRPLLAELAQATRAYADYTNGRAERRVQEAAEQYATQRALLVGICLAAFTAAAVAALLITRSVTRAPARSRSN